MTSIDLHTFSRKEAEMVLNIQLKNLPSSASEVVIIHGYHSGTSLRTYVRTIYTHPRIRSKINSANPGETVFVLRR